MSEITIHWLSDSYECETCGFNVAEGARIEIDGETVIEMLPTSHCYSGENWEREEVYERLLSHLGHVVTQSCK